MNKILPFLTCLVLTLFSINSSAQSYDILDLYIKDNPDSSLVLLGPSSTKYYYVKDDSMLIFKSNYNAIKFIDTTRSSFPLKFNEIDFSKNTLVLFSYHGGDCHARFKYYSVNDKYSKKFSICIDIIYGGCRAGGKFMTTWGLIPKLPDDYKIALNTYYVDRDR